MRLSKELAPQPEDSGYLGKAYLGFNPQILIPVVPVNRRRYYFRQGRRIVR